MKMATTQTAWRRKGAVVLLCAGLAGGAGPAAAAATASSSTPAAAATAIQSLGPGVQVDWSRQVISAAGSCAADLFAASAEVARLKAERLARMRAEARLRKALQMLGREPRFHGKVPEDLLGRLEPSQAQVAHIEYAATGSVSLRLELPLTAPVPAKNPAPPPLPGAAPDAGASPAAEADKAP